MELATGDLVRSMREQLRSLDLKPRVRSVGRVKYASDGIVRVDGLGQCRYGELVGFSSGVMGMAQNLEPDTVWVVLLGDEASVAEGDEAYATGHIARVPVGEGLIGRVVDPLGNPLDGKGPVVYSRTRPLENAAPPIMDRGAVNEPLMTGLMAIDAMVPIGKGQRELIIGDRQTGKTAIASDTVLNQKGKDVVCVYVAVGQKASTVAQMVNTFTQMGAMAYTIVVSATAGDPVLMQYEAPYAGCAIGEELMYQGKDVLVIYDDLSKHAVAYRTLSLLLRRPPGREAYPGDVFYLHSRLLERAAKLNDKLGGGSMTALPIIETMAGDSSAYIPTNVISITDGQIMLESELFFSGVRPAVNVGLSVSRVGGSAQTKAMRKVSGKLRLDLAQYRELAVFAQFSSDLDYATQQQLAHGERLTEALKQAQYQPLSMAQQVVVLYAVGNRMMVDLPVARIGAFKTGLLDFIAASHGDILAQIDREKDLSDELSDRLRRAIEDFKKQFLAEEM
ncbi:MAG: F0F1 ATP synthase subunit alpha [Christensenellales bacterium]